MIPEIEKKRIAPGFIRGYYVQHKMALAKLDGNKLG